MNDAIEIKKVPGKVLSTSFRDRIEHLTARFHNYALENAAPPKKGANRGSASFRKGKVEEPAQPEEAPQSYFAVKIQFVNDGSGETGSHVVYPPLGKHILPPFLCILHLYFFTFTFLSLLSPFLASLHISSSFFPSMTVSLINRHTSSRNFSTVVS
jgi:hypothetical protein